MSCSKTQQQITAYLDGELPHHKVLLLEAHLEECPACMKVYEAEQKLWGLLKDWREVEPSAGFVEDFWQRAARMPASAGWWTRMVDFLRPEGLLAPSAALVISFFLCVWIYTQQLPVVQPSRLAIPSLSPQAVEAVIGPADREVVQHLAFLENVEMLSQMDVISNLEVLTVMGSSMTDDDITQNVSR
jgi:anti-sigma factor (TIGR02949 family)